ncbi:MAG: Gfo/Idh/MocA family oxidoreductase [Propionibacteriaceae bacterium]|jgi:predicted dehydrogenase|nr:Gfo/Idh/MocA family oxidoreductase [Propionibacteriaceae bacterium]
MTDPRLLDVPDPMSAPALRWGILGPGGIAHRFAREIPRYTRSTIAAVGSRDQARADQFAREFGLDRAYGSYEALVADPDLDAVYIATPHSCHRDHALLALAAGKPVLVEKSFATSRAEAQQVFDAAREKNLFATEAMWARQLPHYAKLRQLVAAGTLGELRHIVAIHNQALNPDPAFRIMNAALGGGALLDLGVYPLSALHMLAGVPDSLTATGLLTAIGVDRAETAVLRWGSGLIGTAISDCAAASPNTLTVVGTEATADVGHVFYTPQDITVTPRGGEPHVLQTKAEGGFQFEAAEAARRITGGELESPLMTWQDTLDVMGLMDEVRRQVGVTFPWER